MENRTYYLFSKKLSGHASAAEMGELNDVLQQYPHLHEELAAFELFWKQSTPDFAPDEAAYHHLLHRMAGQGITLEAQPSEEPAPAPEAPVVALPAGQGWKRLLTVAAALLVIAGLWWVLAPQAATGPEKGNMDAAALRTPSNEVTTRPGNRTKVVLPDGTQVWLNADSRLSYPTEFGTSSRNVTLVGEAYFDVAPNKKVPFYISTEKIKIKVTGTAFNVRAYPNEARSETSLVHGRVEVTVNNRPEKTYYLKPSEKLVVKDDEGLVTGPDSRRSLGNRTAADKVQRPEPEMAQMQLEERSQIPIDVAWVYNRLAFREETFREVAQKMEKWYGVEIVFQNPALEYEVLTGTFIDETVQEALQYLQLAQKFRYTIQGNKIIIQ